MQDVTGAQEEFQESSGWWRQTDRENHQSDTTGQISPQTKIDGGC